jgi:hypothetical protein
LVFLVLGWFWLWFLVGHFGSRKTDSEGLGLWHILVRAPVVGWLANDFWFWFFWFLVGPESETERQVTRSSSRNTFRGMAGAKCVTNSICPYPPVFLPHFSFFQKFKTEVPMKNYPRRDRIVNVYRQERDTWWLKPKRGVGGRKSNRRTRRIAGVGGRSSVSEEHCIRRIGSNRAIALTECGQELMIAVAP